MPERPETFHHFGETWAIELRNVERRTSDLAALSLKFTFRVGYGRVKQGLVELFVE